MIARPGRLRLRTLAVACDLCVLLRPVLTAVWLIGLPGWLADDSGVSVAGAALPMALPLAIALVTAAAAAGDGDLPGSRPRPELRPRPAGRASL